MARTALEEQKHRRRRRLLRGLLLGGAAIGVPALANLLLARRTRALEAPVWGRGHRYAWRFGEIAFQRLGQGSPVVLLHSFGPGHDAAEWRGVAESLAATRRVHALDFLGWGRSDKPAMVYDGEVYIRLVADFLADAVGEPATVVAAGLAAAYAIQVAVDRPELVAILGLVAPHGLDAGADEPDLQDALVHRALRLPILGRSAMNLYTSRAALRHHLRELVASPERVDAALVDHHYRSSHQPGARYALSAWLAGYLNHGVEGAVERLSQPVWLAWGREAGAPAVAAADLWLHHLPGAELDVFEGTGGRPHQEVPERFSLRLESFLAAAAGR